MGTHRKDQLEMRQVTNEHTQDSIDLLKYVFQVTHQDVSQIGESQLARWKKPMIEECSVLGWFSNNKLISQMVVYPFSVNIHGQPYKMGGVTGVGTYPEYAGLGLMNDLMKESLKLMKERGQTISYLFPYSIPYYRKKAGKSFQMSLRTPYVIRKSLNHTKFLEESSVYLFTIMTFVKRTIRSPKMRMAP
ncbi:GNAT family N-acetyltransferase [Bacillus sp. JCM 19041]|uniref:GNAT family N-acetyltransferase n=1 Tax=Bacillus sp. JCM 19041 TaxID=1460637 RepID=UPI000A8E33FA